MSRSDALRTYNDAMARIKRTRFLDFGRKKSIQEARQDLKILYKQLRDALDVDYAALIAAGLGELEQSQNELRSSAVWFTRAADMVTPNFADETERHMAMEQYERAIKNLQTARSEHVAAAQLIITAGKLESGVSQRYLNQFLYDPELRKKGRHQIAKYLIEAANLRSEDFTVPLLIQATCYLSDYNDARNYIDRAKKISNGPDVQILELLFDLKHCDNLPVEPIDWDTTTTSELDDLLQSITLLRTVPNNESDLIALLSDLGSYISSPHLKCFQTEILLSLFNKIGD